MKVEAMPQASSSWPRASMPLKTGMNAELMAPPTSKKVHQIRNVEGGSKGVGFPRQAEHFGDGPLPDESEKPRDQDEHHDDAGVFGDGAALTLLHCSFLQSVPKANSSSSGRRCPGGALRGATQVDSMRVGLL